MRGRRREGGVHALVDVGAFICDELGKTSRSRAANAITAKRKMREAAAAKRAEKEGRSKPAQQASSS